MTDDRRERPWRKLRVIVEVTVPPTSRARERDLVHFVAEHIPHLARLPRPIHDNAHEAAVRIKSFTSFWPAFLRLEKGLRTNFRKKEKRDDPYNGL